MVERKGSKVNLQNELLQGDVCNFDPLSIPTWLFVKTAPALTRVLIIRSSSDGEQIVSSLFIQHFCIPNVWSIQVSQKIRPTFEGESEEMRTASSVNGSLRKDKNFGGEEEIFRLTLPEAWFSNLASSPISYFLVRHIQHSLQLDREYHLEVLKMLFPSLLPPRGFSVHFVLLFVWFLSSLLTKFPGETSWGFERDIRRTWRISDVVEDEESRKKGWSFWRRTMFGLIGTIWPSISFRLLRKGHINIV